MAGVALAVAVAGVNVSVVVPLWSAAPAVAEEGASTLTVMSHNVHGGGAERQQAAVDAIAAEGADLGFLFEVTPEVQGMVGAMPAGYRVVYPGAELPPLGILVLARVPVTSVGYVPSARGVATEAVEVTASVGGTEVHVLGIRPRSPRSWRRAAERDAELTSAATWARERSGPAAVVGDLNVTPWNAAFRRLLRDGDLVSSQPGFGLQSTWPASSSRVARVVWLPPPLRLPIDHVLHRNGVVTIDRRLGPALGSTHRSLVVRLALPVPAPGGGPSAGP
jgi:endonuclease/exonuclease/phosphatase (EEP) superfamily protein YafD